MRRKLICVALALLVASGLLFGRGKQEQAPETTPEQQVPSQQEEAEQKDSGEQSEADEKQEGLPEDLTVSLAVFKGPTGFGYVQLIEDGDNFVDGITITTDVLPSPNEAVARLISGEIDVAALPVNLAASLYNKDVDITMAAVTGKGMLYLMSSSAQSGSELTDFAGKTIHVPGAGSSPDFVTKYVLENSGLQIDEDVELDYSINSAAQLAQMVIAGKVEHAVLPEPFASMTATKSEKVKRAVDLQEAWSDLSGQGNYPMTALVMRSSFVEDYPAAARAMRMGVQDSIDWVNENPGEAASLIEKYEILSADLAEPAIPNCSLEYTPAADAVDDVEAYLSVLASFDPDSIGGDLPDEAFYMEK
ncbi:MAG: ABC transporter substrate-binding protein [Spirochaetota bacterium]